MRCAREKLKHSAKQPCIRSMDYKAQIRSLLKQRRLELWNQVTKLYEIEDSLNTKVHTWIMDGSFSERATQMTKPVVRPDDRLYAPLRL